MGSKDQAGGLARYFAAIRSRRVLEVDEERALTSALRAGSREARDVLVESNLAFVARIANEYRRLGVPYEDLLNEGNVGLLEAAERFDPGRGVRFLTYAAWWIRKSILRAIGEHSSLVRIPETQAKHVREFRAVEARLRQRLGRSPRRDEVSGRLDLEPERVETLLRAAARPLSLDQPSRGDDDGRPLGDTLVDRRGASTDETLESAEAAARVLAAVRLLPATRRRVIRARFGLGGRPPMTLERIGRLLGVSRERVRQIESAALDELRRLLRRPTVASGRVRIERDAPGALGGGESMPRRRLSARLSSPGTHGSPDRLPPACKDL